MRTEKEKKSALFSQNQRKGFVDDCQKLQFVIVNDMSYNDDSRKSYSCPQIRTHQYLPIVRQNLLPTCN